MALPTARRGLLERMVGAALLDGDVYEEVEHDPNATVEAALVVVLAAIAAGIGVLREGLAPFVVAIVVGLIGWAVYAYLAYWVGTRLFSGPQTVADWGQLLRTLGFANSPRLLLVLGVIPIVGAILSFIVFVWVLVTTVVAIRHALDVGLGAAIGTAIVSWLAFVIISFVVSLLVGIFT